MRILVLGHAPGIGMGDGSWIKNRFAWRHGTVADETDLVLQSSILIRVCRLEGLSGVVSLESFFYRDWMWRSSPRSGRF